MPSLSELPLPPSNKEGWPWTEQSNVLPDKMPGSLDWPRITIVTPNYNYGMYLEETIRSVLLQNYPNLEYIVLDGGSSDNSIAIIEKYADFLTYWHSKHDHGQAASILDGLHKSTGSWFNWINSDDRLEPNALHHIASISKLSPNARWISGCRHYMNEKSDVFLADNARWRSNPQVLGLRLADFPQDATFLRTDFFRENQHLFYTELNNIFDTLLYEWLLKKDKPLLTTTTLSSMRIHDNQKTKNISQIQKELSQVRWPDNGLLKSVILRLLRTRFHVHVERILKKSISWRFNPILRDWKVAIYDNDQSRWDLFPAWQFVRYR
jgi:glycosyltransferase involved in cell wall biosynthesis